jgi:hypothetical protein
MKQLRKGWSWPTVAAPLVFGLALVLVVTSCGQADNPVAPSATPSQLAANVDVPPTPTPTPDITPTPTPTPGLQGCTPGYWKQDHHFDSWPAPYESDQLFDLYFDNAFPGQTLHDVVSNGGGGLDALGRHAVAALLNAGAGAPAYPLTTAQVIAAFNSAFASDDYETQKDIFDRFNNLGCPLN